jgi:acetate CoA/acetoacetate CoA-transferase alpha subunit
MNKLVSAIEAVSTIQSGMTVMIGGFLGVGTPESLITALLEKGVTDLTVIANDTAMPDKGIGRLVVARRVRRVIASHIGTNPETGRQMQSGETQVELVPQGTLVERIRAGGAGLGGILTPTGIGTVVEQGKEKLVVNGREYLLETPLRADVALIYAATGDQFGNLYCHGTGRNFNPVMAMAADHVVAEISDLSDGNINPDIVHIPGVLVHRLVRGA